MKNKEIIRTIKFVLFSASAGIIELSVFALLNETLALPYWPCYLTALLLSVLWNFTFNRRFTFQSSANIARSMLLVFAFYCVFTPVSTVLGNYLAEDLLWNEYLVTGINMLCNLALEYLYNRFIVYRGSIDTNAAAKRKQEAENFPTAD